MTNEELTVLKVLNTLGYEGLCRDKHGRLNIYKHNHKGVYIQEILNGFDNLFTDLKSSTKLDDLMGGEL